MEISKIISKLVEATIDKTPKIPNSISIKYILAESSIYFDDIVGIDAGTRHIGIAQLYHQYINLWEIYIERGNTTEERIRDTWNLLNNLLIIIPKTIVIEGASYADKFRQVELEDIRCGVVSWAMNEIDHIEIQTVPPMTIRKTVFGSGKIKNPWKEQGLPDNAAAALGCALYPIFKEEQK